MARKKVIKDEVLVKETPVIEDAPVVEEPKKTSATVYSATGGVIRVYDLKTHGENFEKLAEQMASQHPNSRIEVR